MPTILLPSFTSLHTAQSFLRENDFFRTDDGPAVLRFDPQWVYLEPFALAMLAAWGVWCRGKGIPIQIENLGQTADYAWRMRLFEHLGVEYAPNRKEREEAGRFLPLTQVRTGAEIRTVIESISELLHLEHDPESLAAVQYCVSELLRNVIEHSGSPDGAFICAHNYARAKLSRVTIGVADCGIGIRRHLARAHAAAQISDESALRLAMRPGVTGAVPGMYGTAENAGAGLFITRSIAKGSGGYFFLLSGSAAYRLLRARGPLEQTELPLDPVGDRHNLWSLPHAWHGTAVSLEIRSDQIGDFDEYFAWIRRMVPDQDAVTRRIRFT